MAKKLFESIKKSKQADPVTFWISLASAIIGSTALPPPVYHLLEERTIPLTTTIRKEYPHEH